MANADTPEDALAARKNGAQGIGLCRTEHMVKPAFFVYTCGRDGWFMTVVFMFVFVLVLCLR